MKPISWYKKKKNVKTRSYRKRALLILNKIQRIKINKRKPKRIKSMQKDTNQNRKIKTQKILSHDTIKTQHGHSEQRIIWEELFQINNM